MAWIGPDRYRATIRAIWWATVVGVLIAVGLTDVFADTQTAIFALGGLAVIAVVVFHEVIPDRWRTPITSGAEVASAVGLLGGLVILTGRAESPFAPLLVLGPRRCARRPTDSRRGRGARHEPHVRARDRY